MKKTGVRKSRETVPLSRRSFLKIMKNLLFDLKDVYTGTHKAEVGAGAELRSWNGNFLKVGAGAGGGAEKNSYGSATLLENVYSFSLVRILL
jgi:hypothetical protein